MTTPLWNYDVGTANDILAGVSGHPDFAGIQAEMRTEIVAIAETSRNIQEAASGMQHVSDGISGVGKNTSVILSVSNDVARITCMVKDHTCNLAIQVESLVEELRKGLSG